MPVAASQELRKFTTASHRKKIHIQEVNDEPGGNSQEPCSECLVFDFADCNRNRQHAWYRDERAVSLNFGIIVNKALDLTTWPRVAILL
jgi:hypothetical protein